MDKTKEQIIKPPFFLTVHMFIYMMLIVLCMKKTVSAFPTYFYDDYYDMQPPLVVYAEIIDVCTYLYAFIGICKTLERKPYGIAILKFSLVYVLMQLTCWSSSFLSTYPTWWLAAMWIVFILGGILFLVYLFRSKRLNDYIPKSERKFGRYGWFGILIYLAVFIQYGLYFSGNVIKNLNSKKVNNANIKSGDYYTDGYIKFKPLANWKADTIYQYNDRYLFEFSSPLHKKITIGTLLIECKTRLDFCAALHNIENHSRLQETSVEEIDYGTKYLDSGTLYYSTYTNKSDSTKYYRTYAVSVDDRSHKVAYVILYDTFWRKQSIADELLRFSRSLTFHLE